MTTTTAACSTALCPNVGTVRGTYYDDGFSWTVTYCVACARYLEAFGDSFVPDSPIPVGIDVTPLTAEQEQRLAKFEQAPPAPESFDARAAVLRVLRLADYLDGERDAEDVPANWVALRIRQAIDGGDAA